MPHVADAAPDAARAADVDGGPPVPPDRMVAQAARVMTSTSPTRATSVGRPRDGTRR